MSNIINVEISVAMDNGEWGDHRCEAKKSCTCVLDRSLMEDTTIRHPIEERLLRTFRQNLMEAFGAIGVKGSEEDRKPQDQ